MPLKKTDNAAQRVAESFGYTEEKKRYDELPKKTTTVAFRVPKEEKARLQEFMNQEFGLSLAAGLKKIVYDYINGREQ